MNWPLLSLRIQLALAKFRRFSNNGMDDRANWDRRVGDLQEIIDSSSGFPASLRRTRKTDAALFTNGQQVANEVPADVRIVHPKNFCPDGFVNRSQTS